MRIIHISDLHFGMHNPTIIELFLEELRALKPELILISGDLTQRAKVQQFKQMQDFLKQLPVPYLTVPGNHDIPLFNPLIRLFHPFKHYKKYISNKLESQFMNQEVKILGVNSVDRYKIKDGKLSPATINRIKNYFSNHSDQLNILFFHHNLNFFSGLHHPLNNAEEFIHYLKESPIHIVCTGHLHYANVTIISKTQNQPFALLHAGSLCCLRSRDKRNSFYLMDTDKLKCRIETYVFDTDSFKSQQSQELCTGQKNAGIKKIEED